MRLQTLRHRLLIELAAVAISAMAIAWSGFAQAQAPAAQSSSERGVTVKVTPKAIGPGASEWEFAVVLDTHSADLSDDLVSTAVLVVDGTEVRPVAWTGAAPGGHHREGTLRFPAVPQAPQVIELRIQRPGEASARVFRWDGAALR
ncbi:hypothetical protein [Methylibium rhizosphaerae]|jgi:hypothetical protein|uniref:hypothetical protein n=1 Tax=Methylibium rhizosphaerae TaxID=2570323 RepID=UPI00112A8455|nr:hypothetical protein [Methylibium rhizosphaerae]